MNRIIVIGNGFDLAHGLRTSYSNFIDWVKYKIIKNPDEYFEHISLSEMNPCFGTDTPKASSFFQRYYKGTKNLDEFIRECNKCKFVYRNNFLEHLINTLNLKNWVDIEEEYFKELNICFQDYKKDENIDPIKKLNQDFAQIKDDLEEYLCGENGKNVTINEKLNSITKKFDLNDNILFLNFNYTSYVKYYAQHNMQIIHIHGELKNEKNPIIFGYGNEDNDIYKEINKKNCDDFFKNIKSFKYLDFSNYEKLKDFVNSAKYQIYIWGHSCGNSDGTLLKELFEDDNCVSIKPFYYKYKNGSDNFNDIKMNIFRHFSNDRTFRNKFINKESCEEL